MAPDTVQESAGQPEQEWYRRGHNAFVSYRRQRHFSLSKNFQYASVSDIIKETGVFLWSNGEKMQEVKRSSWI